MEMNYNNFKNGIEGGIISPEINTAGHGCVINTLLCNKTVSADVGGDFTLPDHMPDIRRLIKVDVKPYPAAEFLSGGGIQLNGGVEYLATYQGIDGEIYSVSFPGEYSFTVPFDDPSARIDSGEHTTSVSVWPDSAVSRVSGARRMNIRSRLMAKATVLGNKTVDGGASSFCDPHAQRLIKKTPYCIQLNGIKDDIEVIDEVDTSEEGTRYVSSECSVFIEQAECGEGYADCRGNVVVKHLLCREGGEPYTVSHKIPFSETVELDGAAAGSRACISGRCIDTGIDAGNGDESSDGKLKIAMRICLNATAFSDKLLEYVKDIFSTDGDCVAETETYRLPRLLVCKNGNMTFSGSDENAGEETDIIDVTGSAKCESLVREDNKYIVMGKCRFGAICRSKDGADMTWNECELPFKYELDGDVGDIVRYECDVNVIDPKAKWEGDGIQFDCELSVSIFALGETEAKIVSSVRTEAGVIDTKRRGFTVCYPDKSDSLWSVAKRYRASVNETAKGNGIECSADPDEIRLPEGIKYMIV